MQPNLVKKGFMDNADRNEELNVDTLKGLLREWDPNLTPESLHYEAALVMLVALQTGNQDRERLSELTRVPLSRVNEFAERLQTAGIWQADGRTACTWFDEGSTQVDFWTDVLLATGEFELATVNANDCQ
jgi:hypothetical protein